MYIALINHPELARHDLSSIRICVSGSAPLPLEVQEKFEAITGGRLIEGYGLTEASPVTHANNIWEYRKIGTIGIPFPAQMPRSLMLLPGNLWKQGKSASLRLKGRRLWWAIGTGRRKRRRCSRMAGCSPEIWRG